MLYTKRLSGGKIILPITITGLFSCGLKTKNYDNNRKLFKSTKDNSGV